MLRAGYNESGFFSISIMRILSGEAKGRVLKTRSGKGTRPTDSRSREMLFNILGGSIVDARVLDLYAGSGAVGLEALSRGAAFCIFVEQNAAAAQAIRTNVRQCGWGEKCQVWHNSVRSALRHLKDDPQRFDLIFADPPFSRPEEVDDLSQRLDNLPQLLHNVGEELPASLVIQHHKRSQPALPLHFRLVKERRAGESTLSFFELKSDINSNSEGSTSTHELEHHDNPCGEGGSPSTSCA